MMESWRGVTHEGNLCPSLFKFFKLPLVFRFFFLEIFSKQREIPEQLTEAANIFKFLTLNSVGGIIHVVKVKLALQYLAERTK